VSRAFEWPELSGPDDYASVATGPEVELKEKASRFLSQAIAAPSEDEARRALDRIRRRHHDARHHCWALRVGPPGAVRELSEDDGEPSSSAGPPILQAIRGAEVSDLIVVVTRWFGGVKLGVGGLVRAYGASARSALEAAPVRRLSRDVRFRVEVGYDDLGRVEAVLARSGVRIREVARNFDAVASFNVVAVRSTARSLASEIHEATAARAEISAPGDSAISR